MHLLNPDNPKKPIIGHIFKLFKSGETAQRGITVCWYYRVRCIPSIGELGYGGALTSLVGRSLAARANGPPGQQILYRERGVQDGQLQRPVSRRPRILLVDL